MHFELLVSENLSKSFLYIYKKFYYPLNRGRKSLIEFLNSILKTDCLEMMKKVSLQLLSFPCFPNMFKILHIFLLSCFVNSSSLTMWKMFLKWNVLDMLVSWDSWHYMLTCTKATFSGQLCWKFRKSLNTHLSNNSYYNYFT